MVESDNTAADALLKLVGGLDVVERRLRSMGFQKINVDRSGASAVRHGRCHLRAAPGAVDG